MAFTPLNSTPEKPTPGFKPLGFDKAQVALAQAQRASERAFMTPLTAFAQGDSQSVIERSKGAGKQALSEVFSAGAHRAGPVGAEMLKNAPAFAQNIQGATDLLTPQNQQQAAGAAETTLGAFISPMAPVLAPVKASPIVGGLLKKTGQALKGAGKELYKFLIPRSSREAGLLQSYRANVPFAQRFQEAATGAKTSGPRTIAETAFEKGVKGTESSMGVQARRANQRIWSEVVGPALKNAKQEVNMDEFFGSLRGEIVKRNPELNRQTDLLEGLDALSDAYKGKKVSLEDLQKFKEGWAEFVPEKFYNGKNISGAFGEVKALSADSARTLLYKSLPPEVQEAYIDYGNLKGIQELGKKAMTGGRLKGGFGGFWSAIKDMTLTPIATVSGRVIYRTGEGIEFVGEAGARTLSDLAFFKTLMPTQEDTGATLIPEMQ